MVYKIMTNEEIIWNANELSKMEKRFVNMILADLKEISKMPEFAIKSKVEKLKKKYSEWQDMFN